LRRADSIASGTILNIASGVPRRIGDVLGQLLQLAGVSATVETEEALLRASDIPIAAGDARAAQAALDWRPMTPWERTLRDVLDDWRARVRHDPVA
jgi:nucleoside-diphosphate-sugar epimerase